MNTSTANKIPLIFLFGPTAVGKTDLLMDLFRNKGEIVSADSVQVYKELNIGSAKPDSNYLKELPHHLIDFLDYTEPFSTGDFVRLADQAVEDIHNRGLIPVISGGTAFYFRNFYYGLPTIKADTSEARGILTEEWENHGLGPLWKELCEVDPLYSSKIASQDKQRIIRALEVFRTTGKPLSSFAPPDKVRDNYSILTIGLQRPRPELYDRINLRVELMVKSGLEEEVHRLYDMGARREHPAMKAIGYREFFDEHKQRLLAADKVIASIQQNTRRYAKRQMTFFRSLPGVNWFSPENSQGIMQLIESFQKEMPRP